MKMSDFIQGLIAVHETLNIASREWGIRPLDRELGENTQDLQAQREEAQREYDQLKKFISKLQFVKAMLEDFQGLLQRAVDRFPQLNIFEIQRGKAFLAVNMCDESVDAVYSEMKRIVAQFVNTDYLFSSLLPANQEEIPQHFKNMKDMVRDFERDAFIDGDSEDFSQLKRCISFFSDDEAGPLKGDDFEFAIALLQRVTPVHQNRTEPFHPLYSAIDKMFAHGMKTQDIYTVKLAIILLHEVGKFEQNPEKPKQQFVDDLQAYINKESNAFKQHRDPTLKRLLGTICKFLYQCVFQLSPKAALKMFDKTTRQKHAMEVEKALDAHRETPKQA